MIKSGQAVTVEFMTLDSTGALVNADTLPTGVLVVNGTDNGATVTITNKTTGTYTAAVTLPSLSAGDIVQLCITATVDGIATGGVIWSEVADTSFVSEVKAKTDLLGTGVVTVSAPVPESGNPEIVQGDDYHSGDSRALEWTNADGTWPDLTGATITLYVREPNGERSSYDGSVVVPTGAGQKVRVELTAAETETLMAHSRLDIQVRATLANGRKVTLVLATMSVEEMFA